MSGRNSRALKWAVSMARTERAVLGLSGSTMDWATRALHGFRQVGELGLEQMVDQDPVLGDAPLPEPAGAVGEQLPWRP